MSARRTRLSRDPFSQARRRFTRWRSSGRQGRRIPEDLWTLAVDLAAKHGVSKTSSELHLDYYDLKKRLEAASKSSVVATTESPAFVELPLLSHQAGPCCVVELRDPSGLQMRVELTGAAMRELPAVALALWEGAR